MHCDPKPNLGSNNLAKLAMLLLVGATATLALSGCTGSEMNPFFEESLYELPAKDVPGKAYRTHGGII